MATITQDYVESLPEIYRDILASFFLFNPQQRLGERVAMQSLYTVLREKGHTLAQIRTACAKMEEAGVVEITDTIFVAPTELGQQLIDRLEQPEAAVRVPDFPPLETMHEEA